MSSKDSHLYNPRPANLNSGKEISSSNSLAFTSHLSSLISSSASNTRPSKPTSARLAPKKDDLFHKSNRHAAKRAKLDLQPSISSSRALEQKHTTDGENLDSTIWEQSRRKMREKAKLYAAMKRGDLEDEEGKFAVDFDRKWAEGELEHGNNSDAEENSDNANASAKDNANADSDGDDNDDEQQVEYLDEFGRTRVGPAREARRIARISSARATLASDTFTSRPLAPSQPLIHGDTIQHSAWQPDAIIAEQMAELARKRDRSLTPPEEEHFDGSKEEGRRKGTGFFKFAREKGERERQMQGLEELRGETVRVRREKEKERGRRAAEEFLEELGEELEGRGDGVREEGEG